MGFANSILLQLILLPLLCIIAQQTSPIKVGSTLSTDNSTWLSPSGEFALGFRQVDESSYLLAIWYTSIPDTIVWYAGQDGVLAPKGSKLTCTADQGGLVIKDPQGQNLYNSLNTTAGVGVGSCSLNDTGNLMTNGAQGDTIWQSFDHPRDTLLPSQSIAKLDTVDRKILYSRRSKSSYTRGKFQLRFLSDGNLVLNTRSLVTDFAYDGPYYLSDTNDPNNASNAGYMLSYDVSGHMYVLKKDGDQKDLIGTLTTPSPSTDYYFRATLNPDGVLVWYYRKKAGNSKWVVLISIPKFICSSNTMDGGVCGFNSICIISEMGDYPAPTCECPPRYSFLDENDTFGGCKPNFKLPTSSEEDGYRLEVLQATDWQKGDYDMLSPFTEEQCRNSCLSDYLCVAVILNNQNCWKKRLPLINGRKDTTRIAFLKVSDVDANRNNSEVPVPPLPNSTRKWKGMIPVFLSVMGTSVFVSLFLLGSIIGVWICGCKKNEASRTRDIDNHGAWGGLSCFTYKDLEEATNDFTEELGRGACAIVYKGSICESQTLVAVKKIDCALFREADKEFKTEVSVISKTHHKNRVRLMGFCNENEHRMLVYEFMRYGNLSSLLFGETRPNWLVRVQIALGVSRGLVYLHEECDNQIIHCDIKPQNILLDDKLEARISDFGLSKLLMLNQFQTHTAIRGTKGYVAPEWFGNKPVTVKVDVYSFGVVLLELISCRRCINFEPNGDEMPILIDWALECYESGDLSSLVDNDKEALDDNLRLERFVKVALWCIQQDLNLRPSMKHVNLMLEGVVEVFAPPELTQDSISFKINDD